MSTQELAFRGHGNENETSNFMQIVHLVSRHNHLFKKWLENKNLRSYHVTYTSPKSQNEFINLIAKQAETEIISKINSCSFYTIMADTTPDASHKDMLSVIIRIVDDCCKPSEYLLDVVEVFDKTGRGTYLKISRNQCRNKKVVGAKVFYFSSDV